MVLTRKHKILISALSAVLAIGIALSIALPLCLRKKPSPTPNVPAFGFAGSTVYMEKYAAKRLELVGADGLEPSFSSSDEKIATVTNDGTVTAIGEGIATVTATCGKDKAETTVSVSKNRTSPVMAVETAASIVSGGKYTVTPRTTYRDIPVAATYTYSTTDSGISVSADGEISGITVGNYTVTVTARYVDLALDASIAVRVVGPDHFHLDRHSTVIYLSDAFGDGLPTRYAATVFTNKSGDIEWSSTDTSVARVADGVITPVGAGSCDIVASAGGMSDRINVTVKKPIAQKSDVKEFAQTSSSFAIDLGEYSALLADKASSDFKVTGESGSAVDVMRFDGRYLTVGSGISLGEQALRVETSDMIVDCPVIAASMIIRNKADFESIKSRYYKGGALSPLNDKPNKYRDGYFILGADIDYGGDMFAIDPRGTNSSIITSAVEASHRAQVGWYGVLDGRGHVVTNIVSGKRGLFGNVEKDSEIKNIAFVGTFGHTDGTDDANSGLVAEVIVGKLDNVLVVVDKIPTKETVKTDNSGNLADTYGKAGICTLLYGEISNSVCAVTTVQNRTSTGLNPSVLACRVEGNPVDVQPFGSMRNTFGLARGDLTAVDAYPNHNPAAFQVMTGFLSLKNSIDTNGFKQYWTFGDEALTFGAYELRF